MSKQNDGGPAFPFGQMSEATGQPVNGYHNDGMSLRDWFAGQVLAGNMAAGFHTSFKEEADGAYEAADAMLEAREIRGKE